MATRPACPSGGERMERRNPFADCVSKTRKGLLLYAPFSFISYITEEEKGAQRARENKEKIGDGGGISAQGLWAGWVARNILLYEVSGKESGILLYILLLIYLYILKSKKKKE